MAGILLNYIETELYSDQIQIMKLPKMDMNIKTYRENYGDKYNFYFYKGEMFYWAKTEMITDELNGVNFTASRKDMPQAFSKVIEVSLIDLFFNLKNPDGSKVYQVFKNSHYAWELVSNKNEIEGLITGLGIYRKITLHPVYLQSGDKILIGFTLSASLKYRFLWKASQFVQNGIDTDAFTILEDDTAIADLPSIYHFLKATGTQQLYDAKVAGLEHNETTYTVIDKIVKWLNTKTTNIHIPGNRIKSFRLRYLPFAHMQASEIYSPTRYFYSNAINQKKISYYNKQVKEYKPFSYGMFEDKEVNIGVLFPAEYEGRTESFLKMLEKDLKEDLHLKKITYMLFKISDTSLDAYKKGIYSNNSALKKADIVLVIVNEGHEILPPNLSPYYLCKAKLIGEGIPTQDIQVETISKKIQPLVMSNISLNIYAKLGGTAWTIEKEEKLKDELIIGVGSTKSNDGRNILGIAQIFHPDGRYIVGNCSPLSSLDNYAANLEAYLYKTLSEVIENHINRTRSFRLIFHLYKSAGEEYELTAIENVIARFKNYEFDYALLHLGYGHNYRLYANNGKDKINKGTFIKITSFIALLHFVPNSILPLKIEIDKRSKGFNDLFYLAKQVYWFSNLSHRSYNPSKKTVTIMYPSLMAAITEKLAKVEGWNYEMLEYVKDKQWFI